MRGDSFVSLELLTRVTMALLCLGLLLAFIRLVRGPSAPDRIVALDIIAGMTIGLIATYSVVTNEPSLLHVAVGLALISFLGTIAVARYLARSLSR